MFPARCFGPLFLIVSLGIGGTAVRAAHDDLAARLELSRHRLTQSDYAVATVLADKIEPQWPGDVQGRLILAWTALAEATGCEPPGLRDLVNGLPSTFNAHGYLGPVLDLDAINEQQLSGHGWLISGLCRYAAFSGDPRPLAWVRTMIRELALPLRGHYREYPRTPDERNRTGGAAGHLTGGVVNRWRLSTDVGCAYIFLEGLVAAQAALPSPELADLIREAGDAFLATDVTAVQAQTHASLCAARNLLLFAERDGHEAAWIPRLEAFQRLYWTHAATETDANWNWFGRPTWTEPCAIVDSFLLSLELWRVTQDPTYLEEAHRAFYNGLGYGEKPTGGFGCDTLRSADGLALASRHWDVPWCCNMRGAVGLSGAAAARCDWQAVDGTLRLPFYSGGSFDAGGWQLTETTGWPLRGEVTLTARRDIATAPTLRRIAFFVPRDVPREKVAISVNGRDAAPEWDRGFATVTVPGATSALEVRLRMDLPLRVEPPHNVATPKDLATLRYGYLVLGTPDGRTLSSLRPQDLSPLGDGRFRVTGANLILSPICEMPFSAATPQAPWRAQVLFKVSP